MKKLILMTFILISACTFEITQKEIAGANKFCLGKEGVFSIEDRGDILSTIVTCKNGDESLAGDLESK